jgi:hypothetical protein
MNDLKTIIAQNAKAAGITEAQAHAELDACSARLGSGVPVAGSLPFARASNEQKFGMPKHFGDASK